MDKGPGVLIAKPRVLRPVPVPRLRLQVDWERPHRVFFGNLADLLLSRRVPQIAITARPARFWDDVFVPTGAPWTSFLESMLWHVLVTILFVWGQSRVWTPVELFTQPNPVHRPITYYPPPQSFKAAESRAPSVRARVKRASASPPVHQTAHHSAAHALANQATKPAALPVTPQQKPALVTPPDIKEATARAPNLSGSRAVTPMVPFSATAGTRTNPLAGTPGAVAPAPEVDQATGRRLQTPQAAAVAPAPEVGAVERRPANAPNSGVVRVVPPPPSVQGAGNSSQAGRLGALPGTGRNVVPPPPSVQGAGNSAAGRLGSLASAGRNVVPPPPSVQGSGGGGRLGSIAGGGSQVVPPPPSVQGVDRSGGAVAIARQGALSGSAVPPAPAVEGVANGAGGRLGSGDLRGADPELAPPVAAGADSGGSSAGKPGGTGVLPPMDPLPANAADYQAGGADEANSSLEELPLGLLGLVFAAPGTSVFSNFEVFVAKRRVGKDQLQLIKLVYEFLPYQRRLSEYDLNNMPVRVIKLRVIPDPSCNETLGQVIQAHADTTGPVPAAPKIPAALRSADMNAVLPCYRTSAEDFQKAMTRGH